MGKRPYERLPALPDLSRRGFLVGGASALALAACSNPNAGSGGSQSTKNALGLELPAGAAPASEQYFVQPFDSTGASYKALDFYETVYSRAPLADQFTIPLVRLNQDYSVVPAAATEWEQSADGNSWTFHLRKGIEWSDGRELTAADYVETMRYSADPKHAWDFTWFWLDVIKGYKDAVEGKAPTGEIGVKQGADKYTLVIETEGPVAYIPAACLYTMPLSAAALDKHGSGAYNTNPATCVTCGPYKLKSFDPTSSIVLGPNTKYTGPFKPPIDTLVGKIYSGGNMLPRFLTGQVDQISVAPLDLKIAAKDERAKKLHLYKNPNDFQIWYTFFDTKTKPFDNLKVRQAFAHSVDRDSIIKSLLEPLAIPAYGYLMPGYPFAVQDPLKPHTDYDPEKAKALLAEAGYAGGQGFPRVVFNWWANAVSNTSAVVQALAQNWNDVLGVDVELQEIDKTTFYDRMNAKPTKLTMGFVPYGMDYFDASNMLSVYKSGGRHNWDHAEYDALLADGAAESDNDKRQDIYTQAQVMLTEQAPAVFIFHLLYGYYYGPYIKGEALSKNSRGYDGIQWPGFTSLSDSLEGLHVAENADNWPRKRPSGLQ
jgi:ABC-type transport system substrate-binding protein